MDYYYSSDGAPWYRYRASITSVVIGEGVTSIGGYAFYGCHLTGTLTIPSSVTSIGESAFSGCPLTSLIIGSGVATIGEMAFSYCGNLTAVYSLRLSPPSVSLYLPSHPYSTFYGVDVGNTPLYVPAATLTAYASHTIWGKFNVQPLPQATGVLLDKTTLSLAIGRSDTLTATVAPSTAFNKSVTWNSSNPAIATVNDNGKVTAVSAGTAIITVTTQDGNKTASCTITVTSGNSTGSSSSCNDVTCLQAQLTVARDSIKTFKTQLANCVAGNGSSTAVLATPAESLLAYPNPTSGVVYIDNPDGAEAEVYTIDGTLLLRSKAATIIDLSKYAGGTYIIKVGNKAAKVVKE
jgi:hypothetical protein